MPKSVFFAIALLAAGAVQAADTPASAASDLPREVVINNVEFVLIPGGWVQHPVPNLDPKTGMGRRPHARDVKVWTDSYYLAKYEARARDFARFMNAGEGQYTSQYATPPAHVSRPGGEFGCSVRRDSTGLYFLVNPQADLPATHLSWDLANEFASWMGFRLPSEAEWVRAFRGDDKRTYPWGDEYPDDTFAGFQEGATECDVRPVNAYPKGRSPFGIYNMAGNVYEYVADWFSIAHYNGLKDGARNPVARDVFLIPGEPKPYRVLRGGRWASGPSELNLYGNRDIRATNEPFRCFGARFAVDADTVRRHLAQGTAEIR